MKILVFKSNISNDNDMSELKTVFLKHSYVNGWSVDFEDIDKVLRIESSEDLSEDEVVKMVCLVGFYCEERPG